MFTRIRYALNVAKRFIMHLFAHIVGQFKPKKKVRFYQFVGPCGRVNQHFYSYDMALKWTGHSVVKISPMYGDWKRTNCFIEIEKDYL
ncbi:MAG: hypothetical protein GY909_15600 [Oligoflexia bacterium]|nr:hypothetical protein [Oligoflexia bacterium]